jgi:hypothetical protein
MSHRRTYATQEELAKQRQNDLLGIKQHEFQDYQKEAPGIQAQQVADARRSFAGSLQQGLGNLNANANSSGMLFSGRRAAGESNLRGTAAMQFATEKDAIASRMKNYLDSTQTDITNQKFGVMTNNAQEALASAQAGAAKAAQQQQQISGLMQAGGNMAGSMGGGKSKATLDGPQSTVIGGNNYSGSYSSGGMTVPQRQLNQRQLWNSGGTSTGGEMLS